MIDWDRIPHSTATNAYDLLQDVKRDILLEPRRIWMDSWNILPHSGKDDLPAGYDKPNHKITRFPACGTIGCISGWMNLEVAPSFDRVIAGWDGYVNSLTKLLPAIVMADADDLFWGRYPYLNHVNHEHGSIEYAEQVAANINRFTRKWERDLKEHLLPGR